jgi:hypothetical protein
MGSCAVVDRLPDGYKNIIRSLIQENKGALRVSRRRRRL